MTSTPVARPTTNDLWASAAAEMSEEDRKNFNFSCPSKLGILSDLLEVTETSRKECVEKRWRYTRKSGETIIFMDLFGKVVKWVDLFKQVGDTAAQYDPVHAALPWAGIRFLLQIAINDFEKFAFVVESATSIAEIICRCAIFEDIHVQSPSRAADELQRALVKLYAAIMIYLSKAKSYFEQNSARRILKSGLLARSDVELYFDAIATAQGNVDRCSNVVGMQELIEQRVDLKRLLRCIDGPIQRLSADLEGLRDGFGSSKRTEILRWISSEPYIQYHEQARKEVLQGTGQWLLLDPIFERWKKESVSSLLWLRGIPGSGKSKLVSVVIEDAKEAFRDSQSPPPAFFYCSRNSAEPTRASPDAIMASIARQLASLQHGHPLLPPAVVAYAKREEDGFASGPLGLEESCALIIQLVEHYPLTTIVIDALDECDPERRADLLESLEAILQESSSLVKIFVSSRNDQDIVLHLRDYPNLELSSDKNKDDIASFVTAETHSLIRRRKLLTLSSNKENLKREIIEQVTKGANGMFRWASLQLQSLCDAKTDEAVQERLGRLPFKLEDLYLELYEKLTKKSADADREVTINTFSWLLCAQRTLSSTEFLAALSITSQRCFNRLTKEHVLEMCSNMIVLDSTLDTFRFAHLSVREFLEKLPEYSTAKTNSLAAERCLFDLLSAADDYTAGSLLSRYGQHLSDSALSHDLSLYAAVYWAPHCQLAADRRAVGPLRDLFLHFLSNESDPQSAIAVWNKLIKKQFDNYSIEWRLRERLEDIEAQESVCIFIACCFDFPEIVESQGIIKRGVLNRKYLGAIELAAKYGSCKTLWILTCNEVVQIQEKELKAAAGNEGSGKEVIELLLKQQGAEVAITEEVVKAAARNEGSGKEVIALLLKQRGAEVAITEDVVKAAAGNGQSGKEVIALLLKRLGAEVAITEDVVKAAAGNRRSGKEVIALLLEQQGAEVAITEKVVKAAAGNRQSGKEVIALLLKQRGAEVAITEDVVKAAAGNGQSGKEVIALLLKQQGAEVAITEDVVKAAARNGQSGKEVIALLLEQRGAEVAITEEVVKAAAENEGSGKEVIALLLKQQGAEVAITEEVVKAAASNWTSGKEVIALLLKQRGAEVAITEEVVKAAAGNGESGKEVIALLLKQQGTAITEEVVKIVAGNEDSGREILMLLLKQQRLNVVVTKDIVKAAVTSGQEKVLKVIEKHTGVSVSSDDWLIAQFYNAAKAGDEGTIQRLLAQGVEPDLKNPRNVSPLWVAASRGRLGVVKLLLGTKKVDVNSKSIAGRPPILRAAANGHEYVVRLLLQAGADPSVADEDGETPFSMAKKNGYDKIAKMLAGS